MDADAPRPRRLATRAELAALLATSVSTLERLWAQRATNGHPPPVDAITGQPGPPRPRWHVDTFRRWHDEYVAQRRGSTVRAGKPDDLGGPADFARACGHTDTTTISHWLTEPPPGFPEPDSWTELPSGRRRPQWRLHRIWAFADQRPYRGQRSGRRPGTSANAAPYANDPRLDLARRALADHPDARNAELIPRLQATAGPEHASSRSTWNRILNAARAHTT
ncbi:hypothetical protein ACTWP5_02145 [Streptomyces sp. 4N509B]|uniref:hypothetical protein n=1 Tax=Streptomyces sp. 4N509B TaxID=3457413 RepID=UPI003FD2A5D9